MLLRIKISLLLALLLAACDVAPEEAQPVTIKESPPVVPGYPQNKGGDDFRVEVGDRVFFAYDQIELTTDARATLARQGAWLKQRPSRRLVVEGHADERGTREYNLALGERRAQAVKDYLVALGVPSDRLSTVSYGKERPAIMGTNDAAWSQNRRSVSVPQGQ
ncbi:peptidoglycan-associated lipoprotein Pal [Lacibacterium aquatile]|uniref:Peptidoglycan-associated lipoprotein n=1 Tax=Lacibacterium aquatile TaxID=1168082 RepID=A0ABW5DUH9_9PROT